MEQSTPDQLTTRLDQDRILEARAEDSSHPASLRERPTLPDQTTPGAGSLGDGSLEVQPSNNTPSLANAGSPKAAFGGGAVFESTPEQTPWLSGLIGDVIAFGDDSLTDFTIEGLLRLDFGDLIAGDQDEQDEREKKWEVLELFFMWRLYIRKPLLSRQAFDDAWQVFTKNYAEHPKLWSSNIRARGSDFAKTNTLGSKIAVHRLCVELSLPCAVRRSDQCPVCIPCSPVLDECVQSLFLRGTVLPVALREAIYQVELLAERVGRRSSVGRVVQDPQKALVETVRQLKSSFAASAHENSDLFASMHAEIQVLKQERDEHARHINELREQIEGLKNVLSTSCQSVLSGLEDHESSGFRFDTIFAFDLLPDVVLRSQSSRSPV